jgi:hypothetical protein
MVSRRLCLSAFALGVYSQAAGHGLKPFQLTRQSSWAQESPFHHRFSSHLRVRKGINLGHNPVGSGDREHQLLAGLVDLAGRDLDDRTGLLPGLTSDKWLLISMTAGAIAIAYNHSDCELPLYP